jgi:hypothetical protein
MNLGSPPTAATVYQLWVGTGSGGTASTDNNCGITDYVSPGNPSASLVLQKLNGSCAPQMPETGALFTAAQIAEFTSWINAGAPNN